MKPAKFFYPPLVSLLTLLFYFFLIIESPIFSIKNMFLIMTLNSASAATPSVTITGPRDGEALNTVSPGITGQAEAKVTVDVYIDNTWQGSTTADTGGGWTVNVNSLTEGTHSLFAAATDSLGNVGTSSTVNFEIDVTPPTVTITNPPNSSYYNLPSVEGRTEPGLPVTVHVYGKQATVTADVSGYWLFYDETLQEGNHSVYATAVDKAGNSGISATHSYILDMTRPVVLPSLFPPDDMNQVSLDVAAKVYIVDKSPLEAPNFDEVIILREIGSSVTGAVYGTVYSTVYSEVYGNPYYEITFKPSNILKPHTKYSVTVNPLLADAAKNPVYPRTWTFTTMSDSLTVNPHGNYSNNVNICRNCHYPHRGKDPKLGLGDPDPQQVDNYCNACHDGTAAPIPGFWTSQFKHNFQVSIDGKTGISACAGCHNPHLTWTEENPNLIQDYYYYDHNDPTNPYLPDSSEVALCENCHYSNIKDDQRVLYERYQFKKWHSSTGVYKDYNLCLRCHDGSNAVNIAVYYNGLSRHMVTALDGSPLNGHLPCAECHNTHGSDNIKFLKSQLGHNKGKSFHAPVTQWDVATERAFCTACHNNNTELYGSVVGFVYETPGHEPASTEYCNTCHGGSPLAAAHAPK